MKYPVRCQIIDADGLQVISDRPDIVGKTPDVSRPHVGKFGVADRTEDGTVRITLEDGNVLMGYECWWIPVQREPSKVKA